MDVLALRLCMIYDQACTPAGSMLTAGDVVVLSISCNVWVIGNLHRCAMCKVIVSCDQHVAVMWPSCDCQLGNMCVQSVLICIQMVFTCLKGGNKANVTTRVVTTGNKRSAQSRCQNQPSSFAATSHDIFWLLYRTRASSFCLHDILTWWCEGEQQCN